MPIKTIPSHLSQFLLAFADSKRPCFAFKLIGKWLRSSHFAAALRWWIEGVHVCPGLPVHYFSLRGVQPCSSLYKWQADNKASFTMTRSCLSVLSDSLWQFNGVCFGKELFFSEHITSYLQSKTVDGAVISWVISQVHHSCLHGARISLQSVGS